MSPFDRRGVDVDRVSAGEHQRLKRIDSRARAGGNARYQGRIQHERYDVGLLAQLDDARVKCLRLDLSRDLEKRPRTNPNVRPSSP